jgi:hypothetical protein
MARRELQEINAGSMADIAFLLLIFFLVTTTMDQDKGIMRQLPPIEDVPEDPPIVKKKNVYEVLVNANDDLLVEGEEMKIKNLRDGAIEFLTNSGVFNDEVPDENLTERVWVRRSEVSAALGQVKAAIAADPSTASDRKGQLETLESKMDAIEFFGEYKELTDAAVISLQNDHGTSYNMYLQVQNELASAIGELRDELTLKAMNKRYMELDDKIDVERKLLKAVRAIYPQRISEAEPKQIG